MARSPPDSRSGPQSGPSLGSPAGKAPDGALCASEKKSLAERGVVVLVENDGALASALRFALEIEGWAVLFFASGEALLGGPLPAARFCVVCNQRLPGVSGIEALQEMRRRGIAAPAILLTGDPSPAQRRAAAKVRARLVEKPLLDSELLDAVRDALA